MSAGPAGRRVRGGVGGRRAAAVCLGALSLLSLYGADRVTPGGGPAVTVFVRAEETLPSYLLPWIQSEVERVMQPVGIRLRWRVLDLSKTTEPVCSLLILRFTGDCGPGSDCKTERPDSRLGWTHVTDGEVMPFCCVDCNTVRQTALAALRRRSGAEREPLFARALGRVIAHEMYHILADTMSHSKSGLAQARLAPEQLVASDLSFDEAAVERMRKARNGLQCREPGDEDDLSSGDGR